MNKYINEETRDIHFNNIVVDCHNDTFLSTLDINTYKPVIDLGEDSDLKININKSKEGGLNVGYFAAFTDAKDDFEKANNTILAIINSALYTEEKNSQSFKVCKNYNEIIKAVEDKKLAAILTIEGGYSFNEENYKNLLEQYYDLGIRLITYVWNHENALGGGATGPIEFGLTKLGKSLTDEMIEKGMLIDVSHMNEKTFWDLVDYTDYPLIASHSSVYSLSKHPRNLKDDQIEAIAKNGGVINLNFWYKLLNEKEEEVCLKNIVDHIDYIKNLVGIDYVGLGSDFDGATLPKDIESVISIPYITDEMITRGYTEEEISKVLGKNNLDLIKRLDRPKINNFSDDIYVKTDNMENKEIYAILSNNDILSCRILLDGMEKDYILDYDKSRIILKDDLSKYYTGYHVITFEIEYMTYKKRSTKIFYKN